MTLTWSSFFAFLGSFFIVGFWIYFYFEKRKWYFLIFSGVLALVEAYYWYDQGLRVSSFTNFFSSLLG